MTDLCRLLAIGRRLLPAVLLLCIAPIVAAAPATVPATIPASSLAGIWTARVNDFERDEVGFLPDGRYYAIADVVGVLTRTTGRYSVKDGLLTFTPQTAKAWSVPVAVQADGSLRYRPAPDGPEAVFTRKPGSEQDVAALGRKWDEQEAKDNADWPNKLAVAPIKPGRTPTVPPLPADLKSDRVFDGAMVFRDSGTMYVRLLPVENRPLTPVGIDPARSRPQSQFHFYRNGRVLRRVIQAPAAAATQPASAQPAAPAAATVTEDWGRYKIEPVSTKNAEQITIEFDNGEKLTPMLIDGRRHLQVGDALHANALWQIEQVRRLDEEQRDQGTRNPSVTRVPTAEEALKRKEEEERKKNLTATRPAGEK
jgi:hypothetical protein